MLGVAAALIWASVDVDPPLIVKMELVVWDSVPPPKREFPTVRVIVLIPFPLVSNELSPIERLPPMVKLVVVVVVDTVPLRVRSPEMAEVEVFRDFTPLPDKIKFE